MHYNGNKRKHTHRNDVMFGIHCWYWVEGAVIRCVAVIWYNVLQEK